jgi:hypothetical protein
LLGFATHPGRVQDVNMSSRHADKLTALLARFESPTNDTLFELWAAWRAALDEQESAWRAWCSGDGSYEAFVAALDREEAAATVLAFYHRRVVAARGAVAVGV